MRVLSGQAGGRRRRTIINGGAPANGRRDLVFMSKRAVEIGDRAESLLYISHELIESAKAVDLLRIGDLCGFQAGPQDRKGLVVGVERHGEWMAVFSA